jgi:hypothetical protein
MMIVVSSPYDDSSVKGKYLPRKRCRPVESSRRISREDPCCNIKQSLINARCSYKASTLKKQL